jgi:hypothetical protein
MRKKNLIFLFTFFTVLLPLFSPDAFATKSRLSGMGDLSIVIEDESNMINLWDFAHNPAGFLEDEKRSVVRDDFIWDSYEIRNLRGYNEHEGFSKYKADGDWLDNRSSLAFRKEGKFALGVEGKYFSRQTDFKETKNEFRYPEMLLTFSKSMNPLTCLGVNLQYVKYTSKYSYKPTHSETQSKTKYFKTELGAGRRFSPGITLAILLGYDSMEADKKFYLSDFHTFWVSLESIVEIEQKLKLGLETVLKLRRADFQYGLRGNESYYFTILRLRSIYDLTSKLRIGILFVHNELFSGFHYPLDSFISPISVDAFAVGHLGLGCSYRFSDNVLVGLEGHFRDSSQPNGGYPQNGFIYSSSNLGAEAKVSKTLSIRGGYIRAATNQNPVPGYPGWSSAWENTLALGLGYQPCEWNSVFEFSYRYTFKKFEQWYIGWDTESGMHNFSLSLKTEF